jgi:hypothetical protein
MSSDLEQRSADRLAASSAEEDRAQRVAVEASARAQAAQDAAAIAFAKASSLGAEATTLGASALAMKTSNSEYNAQGLRCILVFLSAI